MNLIKKLTPALLIPLPYNPEFFFITVVNIYIRCYTQICTEFTMDKLTETTINMQLAMHKLKTSEL